MIYKKSLITFIFLLLPISSFSLTEQIALSNKEIKSNIIFDNKKEYLEIKQDIYKGQKNDFIKKYQISNNLSPTGIYDFENQVKIIQETNNLNPTGIIDPITWFSLYEQPIDWQNKIIYQAQENWKNIIEKHSHHYSDKMIVINIPSMRLYLYQKNNTNNYNLLMSSDIIIGKQKTQTPLVDFEIISLKYNPNWTPTKNIIKRNLYKNGEINEKWITSHNIKIYNENGEQISPNEIMEYSNIRFIQPSGDNNALGVLKFETNSKDNIYLHDTNERQLFQYNTRTYSSGCIRVKKYIELSSLISNQEEEKIQSKINRSKMFYEKLPNNIPVYFDYSQVHFNNNKIQFFPDIYSKNKAT